MQYLGLWEERERWEPLQKIKIGPGISNHVSHCGHLCSWLVPSTILGTTPELPSRRELKWEYHQQIDDRGRGH
jgi:hypothetical protein